MALDDKSILNNKLSPLIEGQVPDFVQSDHPVFVNFLKDYYKFLEAGELTISTTTDYVALETETSSYILDEDDGDRIVTEIGAGTKGFFIEKETITGTTSKATAQVLVDDSRNSRLFITSQQKFITGEFVTGGTSGSEGTVISYRGNPVQNIQQMLEYADVDNTIYDFLDKMKDSFMTDIPSDLASGVSKRDLLKNIKDLYAAKGTSEGHKLFMRMLLGETADVFYPNQYMMKSSGGDWKGETVIRVLAFPNVTGEEVINQTITGETTGATATVVSSLVNQQTKNDFNDSVTEFEIDDIIGTFSDSEIVSAVSNTSDRLVKFTVYGIVSKLEINNTGALYSKDEVVELESLGNNLAEVVVDEVSTGRINSVIVDDTGTEYAVGDRVVFTSNAIDVDAIPATGEVAMVGGGVTLETATITFFEDTDTENNLVLEESTKEALTAFNIILEESREDVIVTNGTSKIFGLGGNLNANTDTLQVYINNTLYPETEFTTNRDTARTNWSATGTNITFTDLLDAGTEISIRAIQDDFLLLDRTDTTGGVTGSGTSAVGGGDSGYKIESNTVSTIPDKIDENSRNQIVLEYDTFVNLGVSSERGQIQSVIVNSVIGENAGYSKLPTTTITTVGGSGAKLIVIPDNIGGIKNVKITNSGFRYSDTNTPEVEFKSHLIVKDVTGNFTANSSLTTHSGTVNSWNATTNELVIKNFDNTQKIVQEQTGTFNEGIQLEQETAILTPAGFLLEDEQAPLPTGFSKSNDPAFTTVEVADKLATYHDPAGKGGSLEPPLVTDTGIVTLPPDDRYSVEDRIVFDGTDSFDPYAINDNPFSVAFSGMGLSVPTERVTIKVTAQWNEVSSTWEFLLNGDKQKNMTFYEGTEYYFDLSHPSLYGLETGQPIKFLQKSFALSLTQDGRDASGVAATRETTHITTTQKYNIDGQLDLVRIGLGNEDSITWSPPLNSPHVALNSKALGNITSHIWEPINYELANPSSFFDPRSGNTAAFSDRETFGTDNLWSEDQLYSIQKGYTGAYLKINIPVGSAPAGGKYYYYSPNFDTMGGVITVKRKPKKVFGEGDSICFNGTDKEEFNFILENGSQDRNVSGGGEEATDKLIMEDGIDFVAALVKEEYESELLKQRKDSNGLSTVSLEQLGVTDAEFLRLHYKIETLNNADTFEGYVNYINQIYEPTYLMNENYFPPVQYWDWCGTGFNRPSRSPNPSAKEFIRPVLDPFDDYQNSNLGIVASQAIDIAYGYTCQPISFTPFFPKNVSGEGDYLLVDSYRENPDLGFIVLNGTDANGSDAGSLVANENFGNTLRLERTDLVGASGTFPNDEGGSDAKDGFLLDDETGDGNIVLDATASEIDIGFDIVLEENLSLNTDGITITDSSGATATICYVNIATGETSVSSTAIKTATYRNINNLVGEDLIRLQDSYYYQDYSYEIIVGQSLLTYFDELKKAVHPTGFQPFGKVSIATLVSVGITNTAAGVSDYDGDTTTFSPELASVLETIFGQVLQSRLQVPTTVTSDGQVPIGSRDDKIVQETGSLPGEVIVLDGSPTIAPYNPLATSSDLSDNLDGSGIADNQVAFSILAGSVGKEPHASLFAFTSGPNTEPTAGTNAPSGFRALGDITGEGSGSRGITVSDALAFIRWHSGAAATTIDREQQYAYIENVMIPYMVDNFETYKIFLVDIQFEDGDGDIVLNGIDASGTFEFEKLELETGFFLTLDVETADGSKLTLEDDNLELELGSGNIVLNGTDSDSLNAGDNIRINLATGFVQESGLTTGNDGAFLYEVSTITSGDDNTSGKGLGGGKIMAETSHTLSGNSDRTIVSQRVTKIESRPLPKFERNLLLYLAQTPFGNEPCGITLEAGSGNIADSIIMDGQIPFNEGSAFMELERDSEIDNIILDGTDAVTPNPLSIVANVGEGLVLETGFFLKIEDPSLGRESETFTILFEDDGTNDAGEVQEHGKIQLEGSPFAFPIDFHVSDGDRLLFNTLDNDETISLSDISSLTFQDIRTVDKIELHGLDKNEENWGGGADDDNITLEDFGQILLNATDADSTDDGNHLLQETTRRNRFTLEETGNLIVEQFSTLSNVSKINLEADIDGGNIIQELTRDDIVLEQHNVFTNEGQIPAANFRLNSTSIITKGNVRSADVSVRDTGDIALEDATNGTAYVGADPNNDDTHGYLVINSTSGSSANAGENFDLEGATGITY